jgi:hypothetical protein
MAVVAGVLVSRFFFGALETRQFDLVIAAILVHGCVLLRDGRESRGALWLGLAAGMKCTPLLFAPYLMWRGRWRSCILLCVAAVGVNLFPDLCCPQRDGGNYLCDWNETFLSAAQRVPPGTWFSGLLQNQSLAGELQRFARYGLPTSVAAIRTAKLNPELVPLLRVVLYAVSTILLLLTALCGGFFGKSWPTENPSTDASKNRLRFAAEVSAVFALMLLLSPMTSRAHYVVLLLPTLLIVRSALVDRDHVDWIVLNALFILGPLVSKGIVGPKLGELMLAWGLPVWYAVACLAAMWRTLLQAATVGAPEASVRSHLAGLVARLKRMADGNATA